MSTNFLCTKQKTGKRLPRLLLLCDFGLLQTATKRQNVFPFVCNIKTPSFASWVKLEIDGINKAAFLCAFLRSFVTSRCIFNRNMLVLVWFLALDLQTAVTNFRAETGDQNVQFFPELHFNSGWKLWSSFVLASYVLSFNVAVANQT